MLEDHLKTFICASECGSFSKAAEQLFLSSNAVKKRINYLEESSGIILFDRTIKGVTLTRAGQSFFNDAKNLLQEYNDSVERAKAIQESDGSIIRIGMMDTFSYEFMMSKWFQVREFFRDKKSSLVFYGASSQNLGVMLKSIGREIDASVDIYDKELAQKFGLSAVKLSDARICIGVPSNHHLATKESILPEDLSGESITVLESGRSAVWDRFRKKIEKLYPNSVFEDIDEYSIKTFNRCESENKIILITENSANIYPFFKYFPITVDFQIPFGVYYSENPPDNVSYFINNLITLRTGI